MHTASVEMNGRARRPTAAVAHGAKAAAPRRSDKVTEKDRRRASSRMPAMKASPNAAAQAGVTNRTQARRDRKIALQQDVEKLRKKLRHEENVHRALERAFTRPLGALPRLPPYLPSQTLELLAEVAVLEEEVVRLEEQVVGFRQGLYQEAIIVSLAKSAYLSDGDERCAAAPAQLWPSTGLQNSDEDANWSSLKRATNAKQTPRKPGPSLSHGDRRGKENQSCTSNSCRDFSRSPMNNVPRCISCRDFSRSPMNNVPRCSAPVQQQWQGAKESFEDNAIVSDKASAEANKVAEELLTCLLTVFTEMSISSSGGQDEDRASSPSVSGSCEGSDDAACARDPYGVLEFGSRDIGPYKQFRQVDATSFHQNGSAGDAVLGRRLKAMLRKLSAVDLVGLSHQQRLAFWINTYNSCMMNAFLEQGAPTTPHMLVAMMPKATINVGGRVLSAMTIEHFILRLPYTAKHVNDPKGEKNAGDDAAERGAFGLEWPEPRVTFALSCGSWSSPAVRVYTASQVEEELEAAKRDYLQAAVGVSAPSRLAIPKLLHWYLVDFAKDVSSLMDWVCLQLPGELRRDAIEVVEAGRRSSALTVPVEVVPYEFRFRYLLA